MFAHTLSSKTNAKSRPAVRGIGYDALSVTFGRALMYERIAMASAADVIGYVGIGVMGSEMTKHLLAGGREVHGYDPDPARMALFSERGGIAESSPGDVAQASGIVVFSLPKVPILESVAAEVADAAHDNLLCIDTGTFPLEAKHAAYQVLAGAGVELMDVPLSGTGLQAADASLVIFASGSAEGYERAKPLFDLIGRSSYHLGEFGNGSIMKYIANLLVSIHNLSTAEAHALGMAAGMDPALVQTVMSDGVGSSKIFDIRGPMMVADHYEPPSARLDIILKDATIIKAFAESKGVFTPLLDTSLDIYEQSAAEGLGELDAAALCRFLEQRSGITR